MKKSLKLLAGICASVMLLSGALTAGVYAADSADTEKAAFTAPTALEWYILTNLSDAVPQPNGTYLLPNGLTVTPAQISKLYTEYYWYWAGGLPISPPTPVPPIINKPGFVVGPTKPNVITDTITVEQFSSANIAYYGPAYTYESTNPSVATVDSLGRVFAIAPGTAYITVSSSVYTFCIITVNVTPLAADSTTDVGLVAYAIPDELAVGSSSSLYAYVTVGGFPLTNTPYALEYTVSDPTVIALSDDHSIITALSAGTAEILVTIKGTDISKTVPVTVLSHEPVLPPYPTYPDYPFFPSYPEHPDFWFPGLGGNGGSTNNNGWIVTIPGLGIVGGVGNIWGDIYEDIFGEGKNYWDAIYGIDSDKYTVEYRIVYLNGEFQRILVLVPKDTAADDKEDDNKEEEKPSTPSTPEMTPEEKEEAERLAELKANIELALKGKMSWFDVYSDVPSPTNYSSGVQYVLDTQLMTGKDNGAFGSKDKMTYADVTALLCKYLNITEKKLADAKIVPAADAKAAVTSEAAAQIFYNLAKYKKVNTSASENLGKYADASAVDAQYKTAFAWAAAEGVVITTSERAYPDTVVTKEMLAQMMYSFVKLVK